MEIFGIILLLIIAFIVLGLLGWGLKAIGVIFDFLWEGCTTSLGCIFWVVFAIFVLMALLL